MLSTFVQQLIKKEGKKKGSKEKGKTHTCVKDIHGVCKKCKINENRRKPKRFCLEHPTQILNAKGTCWRC